MEEIMQVEREPWGMPYKIVMGKMVKRQPLPGLNSKERVKSIIRGLFLEHPQRSTLYWRPDTDNNDAAITIRELLIASKSLKGNIAPSLDGITNKAIQIIVKRQLQVLQVVQVYNECIKERCFPKFWKKTRLALLKKGTSHKTTRHHTALYVYSTVRANCLKNY